MCVCVCEFVVCVCACVCVPIGKAYKYGTIYQPLRSGRIWHKVNF